MLCVCLPWGKKKKMLPTCLGQEKMGGEQGLKIEEGMTEGEMDG